MSVSVLHKHEHRGDTHTETRIKTGEGRFSPLPSVAIPSLPDMRKERELQGVDGVRYVCRCICALLPMQSQSGRATTISARTSFSATGVHEMFDGVTKSVKDIKVLEIAGLLKSQGIDPTAIEGGQILRKLFGGQS